MIKVELVTLPALWASPLVNGDWSGIDYYYPDEAEKARAWLRNSGLSVLGCGQESFIANRDGVLTECLEYSCVYSLGKAKSA